MKPSGLLSISDLSADDVYAIWSLTERADLAMKGTVAWSFEGNGIRTRTTFLKAFRELGLQFTELPNLLKTSERADDLAGYLDPFYDLFVIRENSHDALKAFAEASTRPVINAMSNAGHPCEVLADAFHLQRSVRDLRNARICLWGPTTNVFRSWHELAALLGFRILQVCDPAFHSQNAAVEFSTTAPVAVDAVITDSWPSAMNGRAIPLTIEALARMGSPALLPTPPFTIGGELMFDPRDYPAFVGDKQKELLVPIQKAIVRYTAGVRPPPKAR